MRTIKIFLFLTISLVLIYQSCENKAEINLDKYDVAIFDEAGEISINSDEDVKEYFLSQVDVKKNKFISVVFEEIEHPEGNFYIIQGKYKRDDKLIETVALPFGIKDKKAGATQYLTAFDCKMTCTSSGTCSGCEQIVHEPCKRQTCRCTSSVGDSGGCTTSMSF